MSGLSRRVGLSARSLKFTGSSVPTRAALPEKRTRRDSRPRPTGPQQTPYFQEHLNQMFSPLQFPKELAKRILTHSSHNAAIAGHNSRLAFLGRRVISAYLLLFLHSSSALQPFDDFWEIKRTTLDTEFIGEIVGREWGVGRVIRWTPSAPAQERAHMNRKPDIRRKVGLYKVQGEAVQAILGGIYFQFGGVIAQRVFHTRLLPLLLVDRGLPKVFHNDAISMRQRMDRLPLDAKGLL